MFHIIFFRLVFFVIRFGRAIRISVKSGVVLGFNSVFY